MNSGSPPEWVSAFANLGVFVIALTAICQRPSFVVRDAIVAAGIGRPVDRDD